MSVDTPEAPTKKTRTRKGRNAPPAPPPPPAPNRAAGEPGELPRGPLTITLRVDDYDRLTRDDAAAAVLTTTARDTELEWSDDVPRDDAGRLLYESEVLEDEDLARIRPALAAAGVWWAESIPAGRRVREVPARDEAPGPGESTPAPDPLADGPLTIALHERDFARLKRHPPTAEVLCWTADGAPIAWRDDGPDADGGLYVQSDVLAGEDLRRVRSALNVDGVWRLEVAEGDAERVREVPALPAAPKPAPAAAAEVRAAHTEHKAVALDLIDESPSNPRKSFDGLDELAESLRQHGLVQAVVVRPRAAGRFELVVGHRRFRAARLAGWTEIPAAVRELSDREVLEVQLVENAKRVDIHPLEEADALRALKETHHLAVEEIAAKVAKSVDTIRKRLKLCALAPEAREAYFEGKLLHAVAFELARIPRPELQVEALRAVLREAYGGGPMPVRQAVEIIHGRYHLRLADATFDRGDATLVPEAGACAPCPKRTGNQPELFADVKAKDVCTDPVCFAAKRDADWKRRTAAAKDAGQRVLTAKEAKEVFPWGERADERSGYVALDDVCYDDPKGRTYKALLGKGTDVPVVLARDPRGDVRELAARKDADKALRAAGVGGRSSSSSSGSSGLTPAQKRAAERAKHEAAAARDAMAAVVAAVEKQRDLPDALLRVVARGMVEGLWSDTAKKIATRRGLLGDKGAKRDTTAALVEAIDGAAGGTLRGLVVELAVARYADVEGESWQWKGPTAFAAACALFKVDPKKILEQLVDGATAKRATKTKLAASKKKPAGSKRGGAR